MAVEREDVSQRTGREEALRAREQRLKLALQASRMVAWEWDPARNAVTTTENLSDIYGIPTLEGAEQGFSMVHPDDVERHRATVDRAIAAGTSYQSEFRIVRPDNGAVVWLEERGTPVLDKAGNLQKVAGVVMDITARKGAEEVVRGQAALLDLTVDAILVRAFASDTIQFWNRGAEELYGFSRDEVIGRVSHEVLQTIHPIPIEEAKEILVQTGRWEGELVHTRRDGSRIVVDSHWAIQMDRGQPHAILETNIDITERKEAEDAHQRLTMLAEASALLASSLDYETTLRSLAQAVVPRMADWCAVHLVDEDGTVRQITVTHPDPTKVDLARELEQRYPYDPNAPVGVPHVLRSGQSELVAEVSDDLLEALSADADLLRLLRELGITSWMVVPLAARGYSLGAITLVAAESGRHYSSDDVALAEVLARRAALAVDNARLYRETKQLAAEQSAILSQMADGVALADPTGRVTYRNEAAQRMIGKVPPGSLESILIRYHVTAIDGQPFPRDQLPLARALIHRETVVDARWRMRLPDGTEIVMQGSATPVVGDNGELLGAVSTFRDITAQVALDQQKEAFLSAAAHDLKTPLTSVKGLAQVLRRRVARDGLSNAEQVREGLTRIEQNASRMTSLINELLDLSRLQTGQGLDLNRRPTDLVGLVSQCVAEFQGAPGSHRITLESQVPELTGRWDTDRLERVIVNLLSNAVKYSREDAPIAVTVKEEQRDGNAWAVLSVADRGIGIPREDLARIFDRFQRGRNVGRDTLGTGIGLSGARQIVEQHGGMIAVASQEGVGSTFTIHLPVTPMEESTEPGGEGHHA